MLSLLGDLFHQLVPFPRLLWAQWKIIKTAEEPQLRSARWLDLGRDKLLALLDLEWERAQALEDKLFRLTTTLAVAVTAGGVVAKSLIESLVGWPARWVVFSLLVYAILLLFVGAVMGFSGLRPKPRPGYGPDFALKVQGRGVGAKRAAADALADFEVKNLLRSNEASAANLAIRNGVLAFGAALLLSLFAPPKPNPASQPDVHVVVRQVRATSVSETGRNEECDGREQRP